MGPGESVTIEPNSHGTPIQKGRTWRLIVDGECSPAWNMALDAAIADAVAGGLVPPTLRLYRWDRPALSLGLFQSAVKGLDWESLSALGVTVVRRPTGGRGILHGGDQTLSISIPVPFLGEAGKSVVSSYHVLSAGVQLGLARLGIRLRDGAVTRPVTDSPDCYATRSRADLVTEADGVKLVGSAQRRREGVVLQQVSIRHCECAVRADQVYRQGSVPEVFPLAEVSDDEMEIALSECFAEALGMRLVRDTPCNWELERCTVLLPKVSVARR